MYIANSGEGDQNCMSDGDFSASVYSLTESQYRLRESAHEKLERAMTRLRVILKLMRFVRAQRSVRRFQRIVRRVLALTVLARSIKKKRQFPNMSNPKVQRALFRLKVLMWMKRSEASIAWKEKFRRARRRIRGILSI